MRPYNKRLDSTRRLQDLRSYTIYSNNGALRYALPTMAA